MRSYLIMVFMASMFVLHGQSNELRGIIILDDGTPAIGATVEIKTTNLAAISDENGQYEIKDIAAGSYRVVFHYIGMKTIEKQIDINQSIEQNIAMESDENVLADIVISAKSTRRDQAEKAIQIASIDIKNVQTKVKSLTEAIDQLSGVRVRSAGTLGGREDINLNGLTGSAVRTYLDGMPLEFIFPSGSLGNIPLSNVKRIDVYKGVVPVDIGTDAMGGGVNVVSEYKAFNSLKASYGFGSFNTHQATIEGTYAFSDHIIVGLNSALNYSDNDFSMKAYVWETQEEEKVKRFHDAYRLGFVEGSVVFKDLKWTDQARLSVSHGDFYKDLQHGGVISRFAFGHVFYEGNNSNIVFDYKKSLGEKLKVQNTAAFGKEQIAFIDTSRSRYSWSGEFIGTARTGEFSQISEATRNRYTFVNRTNGIYSLGNNTALKLSNIYATMDLEGRDLQLKEERDILTRPQILTKDILGLEIEQFLFNKKLQLSAAFKNYYYDLQAVDPSNFTPIEKNNSAQGWYGTLKYNILDELFVRASYEKALRIPLFVQFFGNGTNIVANANLRPESSDNYNLGLSYQSPSSDLFSFNVSINVFIRAQKDIIFLSGELRQRYINSEKVLSRGAEMELRMDFLKNFTLTCNVTKLKKTYESIDERFISNQFLVGTAFPNTPNFFGNVRLRYRTQNLFSTEDRFSVYAQYKYVDEFNFINVSKQRNDANWVPVQHRMDAGLNYSFKNNRYSISANVNNLLDKELFDNFRIPRPGRSFNLKLIYQFNNI